MSEKTLEHKKRVKKAPGEVLKRKRPNVKATVRGSEI